ncbi:MAG: S26 family signal peptidase [Candidatus Paceibacterota bacterium]
MNKIIIFGAGVLLVGLIAGIGFLAATSYQQSRQIESLKQAQEPMQESIQTESMFCGNGKCEPGETIGNCVLDCDSTYCTRACQEQGFGGAAPDCPPGEAEFNNCCCVGTPETYACGVNGDATCVKPSCGNGVCNTGETAANCEADCKIAENCTKEGETIKWGEAGTLKCCAGLTSVIDCLSATGCSKSANNICVNCGNGKCGTGENNYNCAKDCGNAAGCAKENEVFRGDSKQCCAGLEKTESNIGVACQVGKPCDTMPNYVCQKPACGNGRCEAIENNSNCPLDCATKIGDSKTVTILTAGNGYETGDIVEIKSGTPQKGDVVYFDGEKNQNVCGLMGMTLMITKITGVPGDQVSFQGSKANVAGATVDFSTAYGTRDYSNESAVFNGVKYATVFGKTITIAAGEFFADRWLGRQCFAGEISNGSSVAYNRFTVSQGSIIAVLGKKVGHDAAVENHYKNIVY